MHIAAKDLLEKMRKIPSCSEEILSAAWHFQFSSEIGHFSKDRQFWIRDDIAVADNWNYWQLCFHLLWAVYLMCYM